MKTDIEKDLKSNSFFIGKDKNRKKKKNADRTKLKFYFFLIEKRYG